jgi:hypothetical protein
MSGTMGEQTVNHPSGLSWERWNWPFKTPQEREVVAKWFSKQTNKEIEDLGAPPV